MSRLVLIRGIPGSGKTTVAKQFVKLGYYHYEADMYFINNHSQYAYNKQLIKEAHAWCEISTRIALNLGHDVVVSNTFIKLWELAPYLDMAAKRSSRVQIIECMCSFGSIHPVPYDTIERMKSEFEPY